MKKNDKKVGVPTVDLEACIGCGACEAICPEVFKIKDGKSYVQKADYEKFAEKIKESIESCPVDAIK